MSRIRIQSDFRDYYDHAFCGSHETPDAIFQRHSRGGMNRQEMFAALEAAGLLVPRHGLVRDLVPTLKAEYEKYPPQVFAAHADRRASRRTGPCWRR